MYNRLFGKVDGFRPANPSAYVLLIQIFTIFMFFGRVFMFIVCFRSKYS